MTFKEAKNTIQDFMERKTTKLSAEIRNFLVVDNEAVRLYAKEHLQDGSVEFVEKKDYFRAPQTVAQIKIADDAKLNLTLREHGSDFYWSMFYLSPKHFEKLWEVFTDLKLKSLKIQIERNLSKIGKANKNLSNVVIREEMPDVAFNQLSRQIAKMQARVKAQITDLNSVNNYLKLHK